MNCADITANLVAAVCNKQAIGGTGAKVYLLNYEDIDRDLSTGAGDVLSAIVMKSTKKGFSFTAIEDSVVGEFSMNKGTYFNSWNHNLPLKIFTKSELSKKFMKDLAGARVVAIVENKEIGTATVGGVVATGEVKYEVYGWDAGLEALEATGTTAIADGVVYDIKIGTGDKSKETSLPKSFFNTNLATTEIALAAIITTLEIRDDLCVWFETPETYDGIEFEINNGNLITII